MAKDAWTTGEVSLWLNNEEELHNVCLRLAGRERYYGANWLRARLRARCEGWARDGALGELLNVTAMRVVDWEEIAQDVRDWYKEGTSND